MAWLWRPGITHHATSVLLQFLAACAYALDEVSGGPVSPSPLMLLLQRTPLPCMQASLLFALLAACACGHAQVLERLSSYLPEEQRSRQALLELARSPQFQQQLATFSGALQTGQLDLAQFGLQAQGFTVADFLRAIQELVEREQQQQP
eukprot:GHRQ01016974.1.p1 GENE.GHRQ01016974.1~~GHRQ01016974.1.p1  ORF type:complete len:149 (+),score=45.39 GHRQ01016974.1:371-817(+)